jgi:putative MFS transporter
MTMNAAGIEVVFLMFAGIAMLGAIAATQAIETRNRRLEEIAP